eukprot:2035917-Rhodomonas_salina.1
MAALEAATQDVEQGVCLTCTSVDQCQVMRLQVVEPVQVWLVDVPVSSLQAPFGAMKSWERQC